MVAGRLSSPRRGRIYDCSRFDATHLRPRQQRAHNETHVDQGARGSVCGPEHQVARSGATATGGASSRASVLLHCVSALRVTRRPPRWTGNCGRKHTSGQELTGIDHHRFHAERRVGGGCRAVPTDSGGQHGGVHIQAAKDSDRYKFANSTKAQPLFRCLVRLERGKVIPVSVLSAARLLGSSPRTSNLSKSRRDECWRTVALTAMSPVLGHTDVRPKESEPINVVILPGRSLRRLPATLLPSHFDLRSVRRRPLPRHAKAVFGSRSWRIDRTVMPRQSSG